MGKPDESEEMANPTKRYNLFNIPRIVLHVSKIIVKVQCWFQNVLSQRTGDEKKITTKYTKKPAISIPP